MKRIIQGIETLSGVLLLALSLLIFVQVLLRNFFDWGFVWSEEMARFLLLTMVLLMSPVIFYRDNHCRLDFFSSRLPARLQAYLGLAISIVIFGFYVVYVVSHVAFIRKVGDVRSPSLNMPNFWFFMSGLVGAVAGIALGILKIISDAPRGGGK